MGERQEKKSLIELYWKHYSDHNLTQTEPESFQNAQIEKDSESQQMPPEFTDDQSASSEEFHHHCTQEEMNVFNYPFLHP